MMNAADGFSVSNAGRIDGKRVVPFFTVGFVLFLLVPLCVVKPDFLLLGRFVPGGAWIETLVLGLYAGFLSTRMIRPSGVPAWRRISWLIYTAWFFLQLGLGIFVDRRFLLTGHLHIPVPALIISQPIYEHRWTVMIFLFLGTVIAAGPAWCSQLCYLGGADNWAASFRKGVRGRALAGKDWKYFFLGLSVIAALLLRFAGAGPALAGGLALGFGAGGLLVMAAFSTRTGRMVHCTTVCPVGGLVSLLKKISPFRLYIDGKCADCMACLPACRYDALSEEEIRRGQPGSSCTLCGDCLASCKPNAIRYGFLGLSAGASRNLWLILTLSLHAVFLGLGRI